MNKSEYDIPILNIRYMLTNFKLNLANQTFIENEVPSLKKLLSHSEKVDLIQTANFMVGELFKNSGLDLDFDIFVEDDIDDKTIYYLNIIVTNDGEEYKSVLTIRDDNLVDDYESFREELTLDKVY